MIDEASPPKKRGPKPIGDAPMTAAERQRRRREHSRAEGGKGYLIQLNGVHQQLVEAMAVGQGISGNLALHGLLEASLDRFAGVMKRVERLQSLGATEAEIAAFVQAHLLPPLPDLDSLEVTTLQQ
jgi:hypothetical protein